VHRDLADQPWTEIPSHVTVLVPVGSCEQHGPHLPIGTDAFIATAVAMRAAARTPGCVVAPALAITASGEHQGFPGTLSIGTEVMTAVVVELARSATWADRVVFVNAHGGNAEALRAAAATLAHEHRAVTIWWPDVHGLATSGDLHAGHLETSIMLAIHPELVRADRMAAGPTPPPSLDELVRHGVLAVSPNGVLGDPTAAAAADGDRLLDAFVEQLLAALVP
jgi:mycofactocin precursor peptide peptidase